MSRESGLTLIEVMIAMIVMGGVIAAGAGLVLVLDSDEKASAAYGADLRGLRRAVTELEPDLRTASRVEEVPWSLEGDRLIRRGRVVARRIGSFSLTAEGVFVTARIVPRSRVEGKVPAGVVLRVRMRNAGRPR